ncbi:serine/threonine-protein kinase [Pyxidicoccus sp. 3LG]
MSNTLKFPGAWRFGRNAVPVPEPATHAIVELFEQIASRAPYPKGAYEMVKMRFGSPGNSSSTDWARSDMEAAMSSYQKNAAVFIEALWMSLCDFKEEGVDIPSVEQINEILSEHNVGYFLDPPNLRRVAPLSQMAASKEDTRPKARESYVIGERVGGGGFGEVFKATRESAFGAFEFAVKFHSPSPFTSSEKALKRFEREVRALQKIQHRGIVPYVDAGIDAKGCPYLVMPLIVGQNLRDATSADDPITVLTYLIEVVTALVYAHSMNVLHRDLKPANILVRASDHQPVIVDFGLAYVLDDATQESLTTQLIGTGAYVPEEVTINPKDRSVLHDVYSCGVILYELLARQVPQSRSYDPLSRRDPILSDVDTVVKKALAPASSRYQSAMDLLKALKLLRRRVRSLVASRPISKSEPQGMVVSRKKPIREV